MEPDSHGVERWLEGDDPHEKWVSQYHDGGNAQYYDQAFDAVVELFRTDGGESVLDAGCGDASHAIRLARRGFQVTGVDFSREALKRAAANVTAEGLGDRIGLDRQSLEKLEFPDESFGHAVCWGVLMHVPELRRALDELVRVVEPGGGLVISECNMWSPEAVVTRVARQWLGLGEARVRRRAEGVEYWSGGEDVRRIKRDADVGWLVDALRRRGCRLVSRRAGQLSELYTRLDGGRARALVHRLNRFWFRRVGAPGPAYSNLLFFEKTPGT